MVSELFALYEDLDFEKLRIKRPSKFIFLCGGPIGQYNSRKAHSLRDYIYRLRPLRTTMGSELVLAEKANELYRDTTYKDLVSFEEDIARIAAIVLVIVESPGSLAELGAFSSNEHIVDSLRAIVQQEYSETESFIWQGPLRRLRGKGEDRVGVFPWRSYRRGENVVLSSASPHRTEITKFINTHLDTVPNSEKFPQDDEITIFYVIYWIIYLSLCISTGSLNRCVETLFPNIDRRKIRNKIYCMRFAGWIESQRYSSKEYLYSTIDIDPFDYSFKNHVAERDSVRRKATVATAFVRSEKAPKDIRRAATDRRGSQ